MSKQKLKKELLRLPKEQLVEQILDLYEKNKSVQEFYNLYLNPESETKLAEKYKKVIQKEFNVQNPMMAGLKYSIAKRAISDFRSLKPSPDVLADVMLTLPECACQFTHEYGDMDESFYNGAYNNFKATLKFMAKNELLEMFQLRAKQCVEWASPCGYGFADDIADVYREYYSD